MTFFVVTALLLMPIIGFLFVILLLRAIQRIVKGKTYKKEAFWSGILFALIVWTISILLVHLDGGI